MDMADPKQPQKPERYEPDQQPGGGRSADEQRRERQNPARPDPQRRAPNPDDQRHAPREGERSPQRQ
jgi:hypothetical protein